MSRKIRPYHESETELLAFGFTESELAKIPTVFVKGESFWRVPTKHFSPHDKNYPYLPTDSVSPPTVQATSQEKRTPCSSRATGSIIECENQVLGERLPLTGTDLSLNYRSSRTNAYNDRKLEIVLSDENIPSTVKSIQLQVSILGQRFKKVFEPQQSLTYLYEWDGKDAYGRDRNGAYKAHIEVSYLYDIVYSTPNQSEYPAFAKSASPNAPLVTPGIRTASEVWVSTHSTEVLSIIDAKQSFGFGGWSISDVDALITFDKDDMRILKGDGNFNNIRTGFNLKELGLNASYPYELQYDDNGALYFKDSGNIKKYQDGSISTLYFNCGSYNILSYKVKGNALYYYCYRDSRYGYRLYKKDLESGRTTHIAGNGSRGKSGDGGLAKEATLDTVSSIAIDSSNNIFISDYNNQVIRRVSTDGIIDLYAGGGSQSGNIDNIPATEAQFTYPYSIEVDSKDRLYILESNPRSPQYLYQVNSSGQISAIAGNGEIGYCGNGGRGSDICFNLDWTPNIDMDKEDNVYIPDQGNGIVWKVSPTGQTTVATQYAFYRECVEQSASASNCLGVGPDVAVQPNGSITITNSKTEVITSFISKYIPSGELIGMLNESGDEKLWFDSTGRLIKRTHPVTEATLSEFSYGSDGLLTQVTDGFGQSLNITRNENQIEIKSPSNHTTTLVLNESGYVSEVIQPDGSQYEMEYENGLLKTYEKPNGNQTTFSYDGDGRLTLDESSGGSSWSLVKNVFKNGRRVVLTSAEGRTRSHQVTFDDEKSKVTMEHQYLDGSSTSVSKTESGVVTVAHSNGTIVQIHGNNQQSNRDDKSDISSKRVTLPSGLTSTYLSTRETVRDNSGVINQRKDVANINGREFTTEYKNDGVIKTVTVNSPSGLSATTTVNEFGQPIKVEQEGLASVVYSYDDSGRITSIIQGSGNEARQWHYEYNQNNLLSKFTNPLSQDVFIEYDVMGRASKITEGDKAIGFEYNNTGSLTELSFPASRSHSFSYDENSLVTEYLPPVLEGVNTTKTTFQYDNDKNLVKKTHADNRTIDYTLNSQKSLIDFISTPSDTREVVYKNGTNLVSQIKSIGDQELVYQYDGHKVKKESWLGTVRGAVTYQYTNDFAIASVSVDDTTTGVQYNSDGLVSSIGDISFVRDASSGSVIQSQMGDLFTSYEYNLFAEVSKQINRYGNSQLYRASYTRDKLGRVLTKSEVIDGLQIDYSYTYDSIGQLIEVIKNGVSIEQYTYDENGNRLSGLQDGSTNIGVYDAQDRIGTYGATSYSYNARGDLIQKSSPGALTNYEYDVHGNLLKVTLPDSTAIDYVVDGRNRRIGKKVNGSLVQGFLYQDQMNPVAELNSDNTIKSIFVYGEKGHVPSYMIRGEKKYKFVADYLGSVRLVVDVATGDVLQRMDYDTFGRVANDSNPGFQPFGYAGGLYEPQTGLVRFGARDYDAEIGRWTAKDPLGFNGGQGNLYLYVNGDPVNFIDPTGLSVWGFNVGISGTYSPFKDSISFQFLFDSRGNFAVQRTREAGYGYGKSAGAFVNVLVGGTPSVDFLNGGGVSVSGSYGVVNGAYNVPIYAGPGTTQGSYLIGAMPATYEVGLGRSIGGKGEVGITATYTDTLYKTGVLGEIGRDIGCWVYGITH